MALRKVVFVIALSALFLSALVGGILLFFLTHPQALKPVLEKQLSTMIGVRLRLDSLDYSLSPLSIEIRGLKAGTEPASESGLSASASVLTFDMQRRGDFGDKTLVLHPVVSDFCLTLGPDFDPARLWPKGGDSSFWGRRLADLAGLFLFQEIRLGSLGLEEGRVQADLRGLKARLQQIRAVLTDEDRLCFFARGSFSRPQQGLHLLAPSLEVITSSRFSWDDPFVEAVFRIKNGTFKSPYLEASSLDLETDLGYELRSKALKLNNLSLKAAGVSSGRTVLESLVPKHLQVKARAGVEFQEGGLLVEPFFLSAGDLFDVNGRISFQGRGRPELRLSIDQAGIRSDRVWAGLARAFGHRFRRLEFSGPVDLKGDILGLGAEAGWKWRLLEARAKLTNNRLALARDRISLSSGLQGGLQLQGELPRGIGLQAELRTEDTRLQSPWLVLKPFAASFTVSGQYPNFELQKGRAEIPKAVLDISGRRLEFQPLGLQLPSARIDVRAGSLQVPELRLQSPLFETLSASLNHDPRKTSLQLQGREAGPVRWARTLDLLPKGLEVSASENIRLSLSRDAGQDVFFSTALGFADLNFQNKSGTFLGEGLRGEFRAEGSFDPYSNAVSGQTRLEIDQGETLLDRFYLDLSRHALSVSSSLDSALDKDEPAAVDLTAGLEDLLRLESQGTVGFTGNIPEVALDVLVPKTRLQPVFQSLVQEPLAMTQPFLSEVDIVGDLGAKLRVDFSQNNWKVTGRTSLDIERLTAAEAGFGLQGLRLELPLWLQSQAGGYIKDRLPGRLVVKRFDLPWLPGQGLAWELSAGPNELMVPESTRIHTPGGDIRLGPLQVSDFLNGLPRIKTSLGLDGFRLGPVFERLLDHPVQGRLSGSLDRIVIDGGAMQTGGTLLAEVYEGRISIYDIQARNIFSPLPVFSLSCELNGLSLAEVTAGTGFGKIQGVLEGSIRNLEFAAGQPQAFDLLLETVKTRGVDQKISVKAVDNIARIGGGQSPFMGAAGIMAVFLKNFSYEQIGIRASLKNDRLRINGTIKEQGTEFLVKKSGLTGVNIINSNPDNEISFDDMVERIQRVTGSGGEVRVK
ncbi:MAG: hypothetical protein K9K64_05400 [Desulfohalobiaceae bacterium]|nr:hypothetical protein [Desulfohalobiaceae bacterium]